MAAPVDLIPAHMAIIGLVGVPFLRPIHHLDRVKCFPAFAPGGLAEMRILAPIAGADLGYIIVHQSARVFLVTTCAPIAARPLHRFDQEKTAQGR